MSTTDAPANTAAERTAYLVLGMHRSGTSAVTQLLALAGAGLPENVMPGDEHNARGYFEPWRIAILNDERLRAGGSAWDDPFAFPHRPLPRRSERRWLNRAMDLFEEEYQGVAWPLLKDPRVTVLLPFWRTVLADLDVAARCVVPVRHPLAVAGSLRRRNGFADEKSVLVWTAYMLAAEAYSRDLPRAFVGYDALLVDWRAEVSRIEAAHGAALPRMTQKAAREIDGFLTPDLRHNAGEGDLRALGWTGELAARVLDWFEAAAAGGAPDPAALDAAAEELARRGREVGALVSPAARDLDLARADLLETRRRLEAERTEAKAYRKEAEATLVRDRKALEKGWRKDIERLTAERSAELERLTAERRAELERLEAERRLLEGVLAAERQDHAGWLQVVAEAEAELDAVLAED